MNDPDLLHVYGYPSGCPACDSLKDLLISHGISFTFHHLHPKGPKREEMRTQGHATVPQVFGQDGQHLGDYSTFNKVLS